MLRSCDNDKKRHNRDQELPNIYNLRGNLKSGATHSISLCIADLNLTGKLEYTILSIGQNGHLRLELSLRLAVKGPGPGPDTLPWQAQASVAVCLGCPWDQTGQLSGLGVSRSAASLACDGPGRPRARAGTVTVTRTPSLS